MPRRLALLAVLAVSGCVTSAPPGLDAWPGLDGAERREVAIRLLRESAVTAFTGSQYEVTAPAARADGELAPIVGGFVPGRVPARRTELVIVGGSLDGPEAPILIEAVQRIARDAQTRLVPERTVLLALWRGRRSGPSGLQDMLDVPLWPAAKRRAVLDASGLVARDRDVDLGPLPVISILDPGAQPRQAAIDAVVRAVLAAAAAPEPVPEPDPPADAPPADAPSDGAR